MAVVNGMSDEQELHIPTPHDRRVLSFRLACYVLFVALSAWLLVRLRSDWISWAITAAIWVAIGRQLALRFRSLPR
jgi:hypothetical protein